MDNKLSISIEKDENLKKTNHRPGKKPIKTSKSKRVYNPITFMVNAFIKGELPNATALITKAIADGDVKTALAFYTHSVPATKSRTIVLPIDTIRTLEDITTAMDIVAKSMFSGVISMDEGKYAADFLEVRRKIIETNDQERRIRALEMLEDSKTINHTFVTQRPYGIEN